MEPEVLTLYQDSVEDIQKLLLGRRIIQVDISQQAMWLDSGVKITVVPNEGGCACSAGDYELTHLQTVDNIITNVTVLNDPSSDDGEGEGYRIFVVADAEVINVLAVDGSDGNGYYGTGYTLMIKPDIYVVREEP